MTRRSLALIAAACIGLAGAPARAHGRAADDSIGPVLFYRQPAREWTEALPIGNGRLGGMVFGGVSAERIQLNEDTFWSGGPYDPVNPEALRYLPKVRQLFREGHYKDAQDLADEKLMGRPRHLQAFQPLGDLRLVLEGHDEPTGYRRELDLDRAVVRVTYRVGETTFTCEAFSSAPDQVLVVRLAADGPAKRASWICCRLFRTPGRRAASPAFARASASRSTSPGRVASWSMPWSGRAAASRAPCDTAIGP